MRTLRLWLAFAFRHDFAIDPLSFPRAVAAGHLMLAHFLCSRCGVERRTNLFDQAAFHAIFNERGCPGTPAK